MKREVVLEVAHRWSGESVPEHARVRLASTATTVTITIDARCMRDPAPLAPVGALPGLWAHEVVECFIVAPPWDRSAAYLELELGPHGHWLAWTFEGYRNHVGDVAVDASAVIDPDTHDTWRGTIIVPRAALPPGPWRLHACAIHGPAEAREYLVATPLGGEQPDFHRVERFTSVADPDGQHA